MNRSFASARSKLEWADRHLKTFQDEVRLFFEPKPYPVTYQFNADRTECRFYIAVTKPVPEEWGLIIGDCIHNARSALDHITWELAESFTGPRPNDKGTQFPIFDAPGDFSCLSKPVGKGVEMIKRLPVYAQALIEQAQPYHRRNITRHPLRFCRELDNADKHKVIPVIMSAVEHSAFSITPFVRVVAGHFIGGPFKDGTEIGWFRFAHPVSTEVQVNPDFIVEIVLSDGPPYIGVDHRLSLAIYYVSRIIDTIEAFPKHFAFLDILGTIGT